MRLAIAVVTAVLVFPAGARGLTVEEILAKNLEARGGAAKIDAIRSLRLTGKIVFGGGDNAIEAALAGVKKRPAMIRTEVTLQGLTAVDAFDGKEAWSLSPFQGRRDAQKESADEARALAQDADIEGPLVHWREKGHKVESLGTEDVDGTPAPAPAARPSTRASSRDSPPATSVRPR